AGVDALMASLLEGRDNSTTVDTTQWKFNPLYPGRVCLGPAPTSSWRDHLVEMLDQAIKEAGFTDNFANNAGIILASTKGSIEDHIWTDTGLTDDPVFEVLAALLQRRAWRPKRFLCISNTCSSSHTAIRIAQNWLQNDLVSQ